MPVLGLTGGVATGKSTFSKHLLQHLPAKFFDADECAHALLTHNIEVRSEVIAAFTSSVCTADGRPDRKRLRDRVFNDEIARKRLEQILHPRIRDEYTSLAERTRREGGWALVDIPLLYETDSASQFDRVIAVACPRETQMTRMIIERGLDSKLAAQIIDAQFDLGKKIQQADHLIWNDSTVTNLDGQARLLAAWLRNFFA